MHVFFNVYTLGTILTHSSDFTCVFILYNCVCLQCVLFCILCTLQYVVLVLHWTCCTQFVLIYIDTSWTLWSNFLFSIILSVYYASDWLIFMYSFCIFQFQVHRLMFGWSHHFLQMRTCLVSFHLSTHLSCVFWIVMIFVWNKCMTCIFDFLLFYRVHVLHSGYISECQCIQVDITTLPWRRVSTGDDLFSELVY